MTYEQTGFTNEDFVRTSAELKQKFRDRAQNTIAEILGRYQDNLGMGKSSNSNTKKGPNTGRPSVASLRDAAKLSGNIVQLVQLNKKMLGIDQNILNLNKEIVGTLVNIRKDNVRLLSAHREMIAGAGLSRKVQQEQGHYADHYQGDHPVGNVSLIEEIVHIAGFIGTLGLGAKGLFGLLSRGGGRIASKVTGPVTGLLSRMSGSRIGASLLRMGSGAMSLAGRAGGIALKGVGPMAALGAGMEGYAAYQKQKAAPGSEGYLKSAVAGGLTGALTGFINGGPLGALAGGVIGSASYMVTAAIGKNFDAIKESLKNAFSWITGKDSLLEKTRVGLDKGLALKPNVGPENTDPRQFLLNKPGITPGGSGGSGNGEISGPGNLGETGGSPNGGSGSPSNLGGTESGPNNPPDQGSNKNTVGQGSAGGPGKIGGTGSEPNDRTSQGSGVDNSKSSSLKEKPSIRYGTRQKNVNSKEDTLGVPNSPGTGTLSSPLKEPTEGMSVPGESVAQTMGAGSRDAMYQNALKITKTDFAAREVGRDPKYTVNRFKGDSLRGACVRGTMGVLSSLTGDKVFTKAAGGNADSYSLGNNFLESTGKMQNAGAVTQAYLRDPKQWRIGDTISATGGDASGKGHIQTWDGQNWVSDGIQPNGPLGGYDNMVLHRMNAAGIQSLNPDYIKQNDPYGTTAKFYSSVAPPSVAKEVAPVTSAPSKEPSSPFGRLDESFGAKAGVPETDPTRVDKQNQAQIPDKVLNKEKLNPKNQGSVNSNLSGTPPKTAIYDVSSGLVHLPDGRTLEAHSGLGKYANDPNSQNIKMAGTTPQGLYRVTPREGGDFHGVAALRLNPEKGTDMHGRDGILAHTYMLRGRPGQSNGCVVFKDYNEFLQAYRSGEFDHLKVVAHMPDGSIVSGPSNKAVEDVQSGKVEPKLYGNRTSGPGQVGMLKLSDTFRPKDDTKIDSNKVDVAKDANSNLKPVIPSSGIDLTPTSSIARDLKPSAPGASKEMADAPKEKTPMVAKQEPAPTNITPDAKDPNAGTQSVKSIPIKENTSVHLFGQHL